MGTAMDLLRRAAELFEEAYGRRPELAAAAPGRVNIIGEHTDYNDGHVLPVAIGLFTAAAVAARADSLFRLRAHDLDEFFSFELDNPPEDRPDWVSYVMGVIVEMGRAGFEFGGQDILVHGDLPIGSGISSSAALEVSVATALERAAGLRIEDSQVVRICRLADHNFVGIKSGPMDQYASRACRSGHAGLLDCRSLQMTHHRLPAQLEILSVWSGIPRGLVSSEYNERQASCQEAVRLLARSDESVRALRDASPELVEALRGELGDRVYRRARHVVTEQQRVFATLEAFRRGDLDAIGRILAEGHRSLSADYEVSLPVVDEMVSWLSQQAGVVGARITGAGFGGSLVCAAKAGAVDAGELSARLAERFAGRTAQPPRIWRLDSVDGASLQPELRPD